MNEPRDVSPAVVLSTCLIDQLRPDIGEAVVRVLLRHGVSVTRLRGAACCGQPAWNTGLTGAARQVARHTLRALRRSTGPVVVPSGSCAAMMREFWPLLFAGTAGAASAVAVANRVRELSDFLASLPGVVLPGGGSPLPAGGDAGDRAAVREPRAPVAYHDSCHMLRELRIRDAPRRLLAAAGVPSVELDDPEWCCGFGGTFAVKLPEVSSAMADAKLDAVVGTGADRLVGCDLSCLIHLQARAERRGLRIRTLHLAEVLDDSSPAPRSAAQVQAQSSTPEDVHAG